MINFKVVERLQVGVERVDVPVVLILLLSRAYRFDSSLQKRWRRALWAGIMNQ